MICPGGELRRPRQRQRQWQRWRLWQRWQACARMLHTGGPITAREHGGQCRHSVAQIAAAFACRCSAGTVGWGKRDEILITIYVFQRTQHRISDRLSAILLIFSPKTMLAPRSHRPIFAAYHFIGPQRKSNALMRLVKLDSSNSTMEEAIDGIVKIAYSILDADRVSGA